MSELSLVATGAVLSHLEMLGEKEGLTDYDFCKNRPIEELTEEQIELFRFKEVRYIEVLPYFRGKYIHT